MMNPINPIIKVPIAVTLIVILNSSVLGFLVILNTLMLSFIKFFNFSNAIFPKIYLKNTIYKYNVFKTTDKNRI